MNIQSLFLTIIIKPPNLLPRRTIQSTLKIPHQPRSSALCLLLNGIPFIDSNGPLSDAEFLVDALGGAESGVEEAVESFREAVGVVYFDCFLEGLVG
jgi:hypothetical protein